jgi:hypothetical protein
MIGPMDGIFWMQQLNLWFHKRWGEDYFPAEELSASQEELVNYVGRKAVQMRRYFRRTRFDACSNSDVKFAAETAFNAGLRNQISV